MINSGIHDDPQTFLTKFSSQNGLVEAISSVNTENLRSIRLDLHMTKESDWENNVMSDNFPRAKLLHDFHKYKCQKMSEVEIY